MGRLDLDPLAAAGDPVQRLLARVADLESALARAGTSQNQRQTFTASSLSYSPNTENTVATWTFQAPSDNVMLELYAEVTMNTSGGSTAHGAALRAPLNGAVAASNTAMAYSSGNGTTPLSNMRMRTAPTLRDSTGASTGGAIGGPGSPLRYFLTAGTNTLVLTFGVFSAPITLSNVIITAAMVL